eukprot:jgi/Mesvir1/14604/Mv26248-RA.1
MVKSAMERGAAENPFATHVQIHNRRLVLSYIGQLLDSYQVRGFGGAPPAAPVVHQLPASSLSASRMFVDPVANMIPGMTVFQLVQMLAGATPDDNGQWSYHFPPPDTSAPVFVAPTAGVFPLPDTTTTSTSEYGDRPDGWEDAVSRMHDDVDA